MPALSDPRLLWLLGSGAACNSTVTFDSGYAAVSLTELVAGTYGGIAVQREKCSSWRKRSTSAALALLLPMFTRQGLCESVTRCRCRGCASNSRGALCGNRGFYPPTSMRHATLLQQSMRQTHFLSGHSDTPAAPATVSTDGASRIDAPMRLARMCARQYRLVEVPTTILTDRGPCGTTRAVCNMPSCQHCLTVTASLTSVLETAPRPAFRSGATAPASRCNYESIDQQCEHGRECKDEQHSLPAMRHKPSRWESKWRNPQQHRCRARRTFDLLQWLTPALWRQEALRVSR